MSNQSSNSGHAMCVKCKREYPIPACVTSSIDSMERAKSRRGELGALTMEDVFKYHVHCGRDSRHVVGEIHQLRTVMSQISRISRRKSGVTTRKASTARTRGGRKDRTRTYA